MLQRSRAYLSAPITPPALSVLILLLAGYQTIGGVDPPALVSALLLGGIALCVLMRRSRRLAYGLLVALLLLSTHGAVFLAASGPHDATADRDEAAEIAGRALLEGKNPWAQTTPIGSPVTTGPAAAVAVAPFVAAFGRVDELSFLFWIGFLSLLLLGDLATRNDSFLLLGLVYYVGVFGFFHAQYWSLEELYYPFLLLAAAWFLVRRDHVGACGGLLALSILWRLNYVFVVLAFLCWTLDEPRTGLFWARMLRGAVLTGSLVLMLVVVRAGPTALGDYAETLASVGAQSSDHATIAAVPRRLLAPWVGPAATRGLLVVLGAALIVFGARAVRRLRLPHPYWHLALGGWVAHSIVWHSTRPADYTLMFVLPAFLAVGLANATRPAPSDNAPGAQ